LRARYLEFQYTPDGLFPLTKCRPLLVRYTLPYRNWMVTTLCLTIIDFSINICHRQRQALDRKYSTAVAEPPLAHNVPYVSVLASMFRYTRLQFDTTLFKRRPMDFFLCFGALPS
jgi:hypothetical protein